MRWHSTAGVDQLTLKHSTIVSTLAFILSLISQSVDRRTFIRSSSGPWLKSGEKSLSLCDCVVMNDSEKLPLNYSQQSTTVNVQRCRCRLRFKLNQKIIIPEILYSLPRMLILWVVMKMFCSESNSWMWLCVYVAGKWRWSKETAVDGAGYYERNVSRGGRQYCSFCRSCSRGRLAYV